MKKILIFAFIVVLMVSMTALGIGCKETTAATGNDMEDEVVEETSDEEAPEQEDQEAPEQEGEETEDQANTEPIKFGVSTALSGDAASYSKPFLDAILTIVDIWNKEGGLLGRPVEVLYYDDKGSPDEALNVCKKLVLEDGCQIIQPGSTSGCIMTGMPVGKEAKIAQWGYGLAKDWLAESEGMIIRSAVPDEVTIAALARYAYEEEGVKTISIIHIDSLYGEAATSTFTKFFESYGGEIIDTLTYSEGDRDFSSQLLTITKSNPEGLYILSQGGAAATMIKQIADFMGNDVNVYSDAVWISPTVREQAGESSGLINGVSSHPAVYVNPDPAVQNWITILEDALGEGTYNEIMGRAVVGMTIMKAAIEKAGTIDGIEVMKAVHLLKDLPTMMGPFTYDPRDGEGLKTGVVIKPSGESLDKDEIVYTSTTTEPLYDKAIDFTKYFGNDYYQELLDYHGLEDIK